MQTPPSSTGKNPASQTNPASVPMYVYRELAAELQSTKALLDAVTIQQQQLKQENQLLRQEVTKFVESLSHLQKFIDSIPQPDESIAVDTNQTSATREVPNYAPPVTSPTPQKVVISQEYRSQPMPKDTKKPELSSWRFALLIFLIMLISFGVGYFIVPLLFKSQSR